MLNFAVKYIIILVRFVDAAAEICVPKMKKNSLLVLILIVVLCVAFSACDLAKMSPWSDKTVENNGNKSKTYTIYVYGAVENEGYYEVNAGDTYYDAIVKAGLLTQSWLPTNATSIVSERQLRAVVQYVEDGVVYDCINVNSALLSLKPIGLSDEVVAKIVAYVELNGKIHNKTVLRAVLGDDDYENYHYKLYIAEADYEKAY